MENLIGKLIDWVIHLPFIKPIFALIGKMMNTDTATVLSYAGSSAYKNFHHLFDFWLILLIVIIAVCRIFGLLNVGNLKKLHLEKNANSVLKGKKIIFLGSSVTKGFAAYSKSFADMLGETDGISYTKEAVNGTTLVEEGGKNYITRLKALDPKTPCDLFVCQLSTNDATKKKPLGKVVAAGEAYDTKTVCGAIEYIIDYAKKTWNCPVVFYTNPQYASEHYAAMVAALGEIAKKWGIDVIDLWDNAEISAKYRKRRYMNDQIHPTRLGYSVWTPIFADSLAKVLNGKQLPAVKNSVTTETIKKARTKKTIGKVVKVLVALILILFIMITACGLKFMDFELRPWHPSNTSAKYDPANITPLDSSPIEGKTILWLGSSVVQGFSSKNVSMVEYIGVLDKANCIKEVYSGTTLATLTEQSYYPRLTHYDASTPVDLVVVQLSTNDCKGTTVIGEVSSSYDIAALDTSTTIGSMEAIIAYAKETWGCPVMVFTSPRFSEDFTMTGLQKVDLYLEMIEKCHQAEDKWGDSFYVLDLWHDESIWDGVTDDLYYNAYMCDGIHPMRRGYLEWWTPIFEKAIYNLIGDDAQ